MWISFIEKKFVAFWEQKHRQLIPRKNICFNEKSHDVVEGCVSGDSFWVKSFEGFWSCGSNTQFVIHQHKGCGYPKSHVICQHQNSHMIYSSLYKFIDCSFMFSHRGKIMGKHKQCYSLVHGWARPFCHNYYLDLLHNVEYPVKSSQCFIYTITPRSPTLALLVASHALRYRLYYRSILNDSGVRS